MDTKTTTLTPDQVKAQFRSRGETFTAWAAARGYSRKEVYRVLNGQLKAHFGRAHEIAVALGLKTPEQKPSSSASPRNTQAQRAA